ncbi:MAG: hypothetical protein LBF74_13085 [Treponema sp.]|jgi:hypothetical protein|nr:hypothetical protein [Treponema sp.]
MRRVMVLLFFVVFCALPGISLFCDEPNQNEPKRDLFFIPMASYDYLSLGVQRVHSPGLGLGIIKGEQDAPFDEVGKRFLLAVQYKPFLFQGDPAPSVPRNLHSTRFFFDGRRERHQFLAVLNAASDKPVAGGLQTFRAGLGWGYEVLRSPRLSLILGGMAGLGGLGITQPNGEPFPALPLPLVRFKFKTGWFDTSFDFIGDPSINFTIAPGRRIRFTGNMRMGSYRSIEDLIGEGVLWYRFFPAAHPLGDLAGIGLGFTNESLGFKLSSGGDKTFEIQYTGIFGVLDLTLIQVKGGYALNSREFHGDAKQNHAGGGWFISVQGMYRF